jgi:hypothetical protein
MLLIGACWVVAILAIAPLLAGYQRVQSAYGFKRAQVEIEYYSADVAGLASSSPASLLWGWLPSAPTAESELFPGITMVAVICAGAVLARKRPAIGTRSPAGFYAVAALACWLLSLGPWPAFRGHQVGVPGPYALLMWTPGFSGVRVPARFWMLAILCLTIVASLAIARLRGTGARRVLICAAIIGVLADGWPREFVLASAPAIRRTDAGAAARLVLPVPETEAEAMLGGLAVDTPVFNGYSGYVAPQHHALIDLLEREDPAILDRIAAAQTIEVVVEHRLDSDRRWRRFLETYPAATVIGDAPDWSAYLIRPTGAIAPPGPDGRPSEIARVSTTTNSPDINAIVDGDLDTRWNAASQQGGETIDIELRDTVAARWVVLALGVYASQYPRALAIMASADGTNWRTMPARDPALATYDAAIRDPRRVPLAFPLDGDPVRSTRCVSSGSVNPRTILRGAGVSSS